MLLTRSVKPTGIVDLITIVALSEDSKTASEGLYRVSRFFDDLLYQEPCIRADRSGFQEEIWHVPGSIIAVFLRHIGRDYHPALGCVAPLMSPNQIAVAVVHIDLGGSGADFQLLFDRSVEKNLEFVWQILLLVI